MKYENGGIEQMIIIKSFHNNYNKINNNKKQISLDNFSNNNFCIFLILSRAMEETCSSYRIDSIFRKISFWYREWMIVSCIVDVFFSIYFRCLLVMLVLL